MRLEDQIGMLVALEKVRGGRFRGLSPFAKEVTPSFYVDVNRQEWHDFASGRSGKSMGDFVRQLAEAKGASA